MMAFNYFWIVYHRQEVSRKTLARCIVNPRSPICRMSHALFTVQNSEILKLCARVNRVTLLSLQNVQLLLNGFIHIIKWHAREFISKANVSSRKIWEFKWTYQNMRTKHDPIITNNFFFIFEVDTFNFILYKKLSYIILIKNFNG